MLAELSTFYKDVRGIIIESRNRVYNFANSTIVNAYWENTCLKSKQEKSEQSMELMLKELSLQLTTEFGKGFDERELRKIRQFYLTFPIRDSLCPELTWTHYRRLIRVENENARNYYMNESVEQCWSV